MRLTVISSHLDDAVFSCGQVLAAHPRSVVITAFAGQPAVMAQTPWDEAAGFAAGADVLSRRRDEDRAALGVLEAEPVWFDFVNRQYRIPFVRHKLAARIETELARLRADVVLIPMGLHHPDHRRVNDACIEVLRRNQGRYRWLIYEDAIYRRYAGLVTQKLALFEASGLRLRRVVLPEGDLARKRAAVEHYTSQLKALNSFGYPGYDDVFEPERYWEVQAG